MQCMARPWPHCITEISIDPHSAQMQDPRWAERRKELQIDDEDGLLQLQAQFLAGQSKLQPAAGVTRITRKPPPQQQQEQQQQQQQQQNLHQKQHACNENHKPSMLHPATQLLVSSAEPSQQQQSSSHTAAASLEPTAKQCEQLCPGIPGILTDVKERTHEVYEPMDPQAVAPPRPFPVAQHRKQSKFALARHARPTADGSHASMLAAGDLASPTTPRTTQTAATVARPSLSESMHAASATSNASSTDSQELVLHKANVQRIADMSMDEIQDAQKEITQRFKPSVLEHLRRRHAAKQQQGSNSSNSSSKAGTQETPENASALLQRTLAAINPQLQHNTSTCTAAAGDALGNWQQTASSAHHPPGSTAAAAQSLKKAAPAATRPHAQAKQSSSASVAASTSAHAAGAPARVHPETNTRATGRPANTADRLPGFSKGFLSRKAVTSSPQHRHTCISGREAAGGTAGGTAAAPDGLAARRSASGSCRDASSIHRQADPAATSGAGSATETPQGPAVARLRFSIHGQVLELAATDVAAQNPEEVLMRDSISRAAGAVPDGYTLPEMAVLVRSRHAPQRAMGFKMLAAVLRRAKTSVYHVNSQGGLQPPPVVVESSSRPQQQQQEVERGQAEQQQAQQLQEVQQEDQGLRQQTSERRKQPSFPCPDTGVKWSDVWQYAVVALRAVMLCRLALDEDNLGVLAAAADSLRVLLGRSSSELLLEEVAASSSSLSWPVSWQRGLKRLHASGVWSSVEDLVKATQHDESLVPPSGHDELSLFTAPEDLAALDPMSGFLATDPLPRIRFLLQQHKSNAELVSSLLSVLEGMAALSRADAESVVRLQHMPDVLITLLGLGHLGSNGSTTLTSAAVSVTLEPTSMTCRVSVLRLLRLLCAASRLNSQLLRTAGLETAVQLLLCTSSGSRRQGEQSSLEAHVEEEYLLLKLEALRVWRVAAAQGVSWCHMDLMFSYMAEMLQPPARTAGSSGSSSGSSLLWHLSCEAFQLLQVLVSHAQHAVAGDATLGREMITPGCAAAVAGSAATDWLQQQVMHQVAQALVCLTDSQLPHALNPTTVYSAHHPASSSSCSKVRVAGDEVAAQEAAVDAAVSQRIIQGLHPVLFMPPAAAPVYAIAAVLQYLATYWNTLQQVPKQMALELHQQLLKVGLCTAHSQHGGAIAAVPSQNSASGSKAVAAAAGSLSSSQQQLALQVLSVETCCRQPAEGNLQQQQQPQQDPCKELGVVLLQHCCALLQAAGHACSGAHDDWPADSSCDTLALHALSSAAAVTLLGVCDLQLYLQKHCGQVLSLPTAPLQHHQQQQQCADSLALPLVARVTHIVCGNVLLWLQSVGRYLAFEGWCWAQHMLQQYQIRLLLWLAPSTLTSAQSLAGVEHQLEPQQQYQQQQLEPQQQQILPNVKQQCEGLLWPVINALLGVLPLSSPGQEAQALGALRLLFDASSQQQQLQAQGVGQQQHQHQQQQQQLLGHPYPVAQLVLSSAAAALQTSARQPVTVAAAAGLKKDCMSSSSTHLQEGSDVPYPLPHFQGVRGAWSLGCGETALNPPQHTRPTSAGADADAAGACSDAGADAARACRDAGAASAGAAVAGDHRTRDGSSVVHAAQWCDVLLQGYCLTWLSVIADTFTSQQHLQGGPAARQPCCSPLSPLPQMYVAECDGSRLPAPREWLLSEIHAVPQKPCQDSQNSTSADGSSTRRRKNCEVHPAAAALLLGLGLQAAQQGSYMKCMPAGKKLEALLSLLYTFDAGELLLPPQEQPPHARQQRRQQLTVAWQDATARWASACLTECFCAELLTPNASVCSRSGHGSMVADDDGGGCEQLLLKSNPQASCKHRQDSVVGDFSQTITNQLQGSLLRALQSQQQQQQLFPSWSVAPAAQQLVDRLVRDLAELSYGDPLFGAHVALLLLPAAGSRLQRCCWGALLHHSGLHLLPPPWRCFLGSAAYLGVAVQPHQGTASPLTADDSSSGGSSRIGLGTSGSKCLLGFTGFDTHLVGDMAKALAQGELAKSLQMQGLTAVMALHGIAALCLDQGSWKGSTTGPAQAATAAAERATSGAVEIQAEGPLTSAGDKLHVGCEQHGKARMASDAALAVNILKGVIRVCSMPVLSQLVLAGQARGLGQEQQARTLVQAAHGDAELMEKVRRLLS